MKLITFINAKVDQRDSLEIDCLMCCFVVLFCFFCFGFFFFFWGGELVFDNHPILLSYM